MFPDRSAPGQDPYPRKEWRSMASVSSVSSSKSIYGNRNVLTGLASGLDTESMIENAISAYKNKITALTQKRTKTEWKQEAYRSIIDKMSVFADKYTSYRSSNNLMSASFFDQAVKTVAKGANASKVSAIGKSSNDVQVNRVKQLATAATYRLGGNVLDSQTSGLEGVPSVTGGSFDLSADRPLSTIAGSMTLTYGGSNAESRLYIEFDEDTLFQDDPPGTEGGKTAAQKIADHINEQLKTQTVNIGSVSYTGDELLEKVVKAEADAFGNITFTDPKKNNVYISAADKNIRDNLLGGVKELSSEYGEQLKTINSKNFKDLVDDTKNLGQYLEGGSMTITLDGVKKSVALPDQSAIIENLDLDKESDAYKDLAKKLETNAELTDGEKKLRDDAFAKALQTSVDDAFGEGKFKITNEGTKGGDLQLQFSATQKGSTFSVYSSKGKAMGMGEEKTVTSYLNTNKTLGELLGEDAFKDLESEAIKKPLKDANGNLIKINGEIQYQKNEDGTFVYETDAKGDTLYSFKVNGKEVGQFSKNTSLQTVLNTLNSNSDSDVKASYSKTTNELLFTTKETGANSKIEMSGLSEKLFGSPTEGTKGYAKGQDAIFSVSINGKELDEIRRSSNTVDFDGLSINLKGTFGYETNEDGSVKYDQKTDANGNLVFSYGGGKEIYARQEGDRFAIVKKDGTQYTYSSTAGDAGKVYGKITDGKLILEMERADGSTAPVYGRISEKGGLWFSVRDQDSVDFQAVMDETTATKVANTEAVTFETSSDADKIVDVIKQMVDDYNTMVTEIKNAYSTLPAQRNNKQYYEPLTDEDKEDMSESAIKNWEEKAKQGILFGDSDLANLYNRMTSAISMTGENGAALRAAGITVNYSNGLSTLDFNEEKFRAALNNDPDKVRDAFVNSTESGAKSNGLMQALKQPLDMYGKTTGGKGILVDKAGSVLAPSTLYTNTIQKELDRIDTEIEKWQDKMTNQVDYYTSQFTRLEQLIQQMNSQSSYFSQLMGG